MTDLEVLQAAHRRSRTVVLRHIDRFLDRTDDTDDDDLTHDCD